ncbi:glycosyltransferase [Lysinibacillus sphaericus]|uniref:Glycosyl transferase n=1 Tax=Lysinibacillus sphaericus CBAM5 TaxID=1400869 RepID=W7RVM5_LYSSH|nr:MULTISPECIES: glycosyltransferase [Lysinibacillus]EWH34699.1 glycosyl transferase [Lysinibacillus sphaericus CBAM5]MBE5085218.1 glycosyltransferase [Bacillus thuringiensis]QPA50997.1 glycosyltransferase [Lysinibacillus sphaericus]QTB14647.1 glycosyltransferase [Lysinibacillus sphaericus]QTB19112.1 glycosyltransferase [Lysinibacillus sphaericus]
MVLVSVIVPVYNAENYLNKCLTSICHQSLKDIEIITINDGSDDQSLSVLKNFAQKDTRITVLDIDNGGVSKARNLGIEQANGQYITFVDADDWLELTMLEELYHACRLTGSNIAKCDLFWQEEVGSRQLYYPSKTYYTYSATVCLNKLFTEIGEKHFGFASCKLYKKSFIDLHRLRFDEAMNFAEDTLFLSRAVIKNQSICYVPRQLYYYNVDNQNSLTSRAMSNIRNNYDLLYKKLFEELQNGEVYEEVKNSFLNYQFEGLLVILHQCPTNPQAIKSAIQSFLLAYPAVLKVKLINRNLKQIIFLKLIKMNWLTLSSTLIYIKVKKAKVI